VAIEHFHITRECFSLPADVVSQSLESPQPPEQSSIKHACTGQGHETLLELEKGTYYAERWRGIFAKARESEGEKALLEEKQAWFEAADFAVRRVCRVGARTRG